MSFSLFSLAIKHHFFKLKDIHIFIKSHIWLIWLSHDWIESGAGRGRLDESPKFWRTDRVILTFFWLIHTVHLYDTRVGRSASAWEPNLAWAELQSSTAVTQNRPCCQLLHNTLFCFRLISRLIYTFERDTLTTSPSLFSFVFTDLSQRGDGLQGRRSDLTTKVWGVWGDWKKRYKQAVPDLLH